MVSPRLAVAPIDSMGAPPALGIELFHITEGAQVRIERRTATSPSWRPVRGGSGIAIREGNIMVSDGAGGTTVTNRPPRPVTPPPAGVNPPGLLPASATPSGYFFVNDWSAPINEPIFYRALVDGQVVASIAGSMNGPAVSWLQDAFNPRHGFRINYDQLPGWGHDSFRTAMWNQPSSSAQVLGAPLPVESLGVRSQAGHIPFEIHTESGTQADQLRTLLLDAGTLLLRGAPVRLLPTATFVAIDTVTETQQGNPPEVTTFTGIMRQTGEPSPNIHIPVWTWDQVHALAHQRIPAATFGQVIAATPYTFQQVTNHPNLVASHY